MYPTFAYTVCSSAGSPGRSPSGSVRAVGCQGRRGWYRPARPHVRPAGASKHPHRPARHVRLLRLGADLLRVLVHCLGVGREHKHRGTDRSTRANGTKDVNGIMPGIAHHYRPRADRASSFCHSIRLRRAEAGFVWNQISIGVDAVVYKSACFTNVALHRSLVLVTVAPSPPPPRPLPPAPYR